MNLRAITRAVLPLAVAILLTVPAVSYGASNRSSGRTPKTSASDLTVRSTAGQVEIKGLATFSGTDIASKNDPEDDGGAQAEEMGAEIVGAEFIYRPESEDLFFRFDMSKIPPALAGLGGGVAPGVPTTLYVLRFTAKDVPYELRVQSIGGVSAGNPAGASFGLFKCTETACLQVAPLLGGYGTTGERIVVALPLKVLRDDGTNIREGDKIGDLFAFTAFGSYMGGPSGVTYDEVRLIQSATVTLPEKSVTVTVGKKKVVADLKDGRFTASFPASSFKGSSTTVKTRTCLGRDCVNQSFSIRA